HTQMLWLLLTAELTSTDEKVTSFSFEIFTRDATEAVMVIEPVEVAPELPWVAALAQSAAIRAVKTKTKAANVKRSIKCQPYIQRSPVRFLARRFAIPHKRATEASLPDRSIQTIYLADDLFRLV